MIYWEQWSRAVSISKQDYKDGIMLDKALDLTVKVGSKTLDMVKLTADKVELAKLMRVNDKENARCLRPMSRRGEDTLKIGREQVDVRGRERYEHSLQVARNAPCFMIHTS